MSTNETPMMQQYHTIKAKHQDAILFFRLGDFYEMFLEDAEVASKVLEITLTSRNKKADDPIPMCGVPYHSATDYIRRLIEAGYKVAICEQLEDPKLTKGMVKRDVVQVVTPGTILVDQALKTKENNYLASFLKADQTYYLFYMDLSTGQSRLTQTQDWTQFISELQNIKPSELVIEPDLHGGLNDDEFQSLSQEVTVFQSFFKMNEAIDNVFPAENFEPDANQISLFTYMSAYLKSVQPGAFDHLQAVEVYELSAYLQMNPYTKTQLELTESLRTNRRKGSLLWLIDQTQTAMGGRLLHQWLDKPLLVHTELEMRHQKVASLMDHYFIRLEIQAILKQIYDLERLVTKISMQTANPRDIDNLRTSLRQIPQLNLYLQDLNKDFSNPSYAFALLEEFDDLLTELDQVLVEEPPIALTEGRLIKDGYSPDLDRYRDALDHGESWLLDLQARERQRTGLKTLKVGYNKVFGYYIELSRLQAQDFDDPSYIRKQTLANSERFITEELKEIESTILQSQDKAESLEYQLFNQLRIRLNKKSGPLQTLAHQVAQLDVLTNFAHLSEQEEFCRPKLSPIKKDFHIEQSRHPVLEHLIGRSNFIANDFELRADQPLLILTGPNMSGKSTYMRQVAYCVIMNQIGCFVPAKSACLPLVDQIFTRIGSSDDLTSGQSTFMVEMIETNYALQNATDRSLILFDEIGRGTATFDGMALAEAIIFYLCEQVGAATIFSTHYHELTDLALKLSSVRNVHVGAVEEQGELVFLYQVLEGPADKSYGIHVGRLAGLPETLLGHSQVILDELEEHAHQLRQAKHQQVSLFEDTQPFKPSPAERPIEDRLKALDLNQLTPLQALNELAQLKDLLS